MYVWCVLKRRVLYVCLVCIKAFMYVWCVLKQIVLHVCLVCIKADCSSCMFGVY